MIQRPLTRDPVREAGFSLIELLVGLFIGLVTIAGAVSIVISTLISGTDTTKSARLSQDLSAVMQILTSDVRRAGYWATTGSSPYDSTKPSMALDGANCILYAYDRDEGSDEDSNEFSGFQLNASAVEMRTGGSSYTSCSDGGNSWESLTDSNELNVTALTFADGSSCLTTGGDDVVCTDATAYIKVRSVTITLTGQLADDATVTKTLVETVRIRNDEIL